MASRGKRGPAAFDFFPQNQASRGNLGYQFPTSIPNHIRCFGKSVCGFAHRAKKLCYWCQSVFMYVGTDWGTLACP